VASVDILIRKATGALERVQCKYTESDGRSLDVRCTSTSAWVHHTYSADEVDWIAVYDATTDCCYYLHSTTWAGLTRPKLRLAAAANGQTKGVRPASAFLYPELPSGSLFEAAETVAMLADPAPE